MKKNINYFNITRMQLGRVHIVRRLKVKVTRDILVDKGKYGQKSETKTEDGTFSVNWSIHVW